MKTAAADVLKAKDVLIFRGQYIIKAPAGWRSVKTSDAYFSNEDGIVCGISDENYNPNHRQELQWCL